MEGLHGREVFARFHSFSGSRALARWIDKYFTVKILSTYAIHGGVRVGYGNSLHSGLAAKRFSR